MAIRDFWRQIVGPHEPVSKEFEHMLMREVMRTELLRVKALIIVAIVIMFNISCVRVLFPGVEERIWRGINPNTIFLILTGFILFEWWVHTAIRRHLKLDQDVHTLRRYVGTLIETSLPSVLLWLQIQSMGPVQDRMVIIDGKEIRHADVESLSAVDGTGRWLGSTLVRQGSNGVQDVTPLGLQIIEICEGLSVAELEDLTGKKGMLIPATLNGKTEALLKA